MKRSYVPRPMKMPYQIIELPAPKVMNDAKPECDGCPYPRHGMSCQNRDGSCLRDEMDAIYGHSRKSRQKSAFVRKGDLHG